jgi:hypothetical protein
MKKTLVFIFLLSALHTLGQDSNWNTIKVDQTLEIALPGKVQTIDTTIIKQDGPQSLHVLKSSTENSSLGITVTGNPSNKAKTNSLELLQKALNDAAEGFCESASRSNFSCTSSDIIIDNLQGKKTLVQNKERKIEFTNYIFIVNNKLYVVSYNLKSSGSSETGLAEQEKLLHSIRFTLPEPRN